MEVFSGFMGTADDPWETELDPAMQDVLRLHSAGEVDTWSYIEKDIPGIILHDRLMTDAALGTRPIKTEHSYSLTSDGDSMPESPQEEMEEECFPKMCLKTCGRPDRSIDEDDDIAIKDEPTSDTDSTQSSCPSSPHSMLMNTSELHFDVDMKCNNNNNNKSSANNKSPTETQIIHSSLFKQGNVVITPHTIIPAGHHQQARIHMPKFNIKIEPGTTANHRFHLPPTPPSCSSSEDSEDNATISQPSSPSVRKTLSGSSSRTLLNVHNGTRQPIHTPLISSQPKGSTGTLFLTEEEKRTLIAEGYPVPTRLPLTKAEEKSLKKIRRKIKNKISAQESRRKKKEYMDQLERKVEILVSENNSFRHKIENLEDSNCDLLSQLQKLQALVAKTHPQLVKQLK